jgi:ubiquinone/menaquinone biosynthesis C-methylase UbiE
MRDSITEMQEYYRLRAPQYDDSMGYHEPAAALQFAPVFELLKTVLAGRDVLELACGPGYWTRNVCDSVNSMLATDFNESTLHQARKKDFGGARVALQVADAYNLGFGEKSFDGVLAVDWFAHVPKPLVGSFLEGLHRVVCPGSVICFCDGLPRPHSLTGVYDDDGNHIQQRKLGEEGIYSIIKNYYSREEVEQIFSGYASRLEFHEFPESRRTVICYTIKQEQESSPDSGR